MLLSNLKSDILAVIILEQKKQPANKHLPQTSCEVSLIHLKVHMFIDTLFWLTQWPHDPSQ